MNKSTGKMDVTIGTIDKGGGGRAGDVDVLISCSPTRNDVSYHQGGPDSRNYKRYTSHTVGQASSLSSILC